MRIHLPMMTLTLVCCCGLPATAGDGASAVTAELKKLTGVWEGFAVED